MREGSSQSGVRGFQWVLIVYCWLVLAQILWNWLIWHLLYPGFSKQPSHRICAGYFLFRSLLMHNPFFFTNIIMTWSDLWGTKWTGLCCFLYICLQQSAWREHTFSYSEATLLLVSTKKFQKIHPGGPELGFWGFNPFVILIFATLDYCSFPWLKWQVNFFSFSVIFIHLTRVSM